MRRIVFLTLGFVVLASSSSEEDVYSNIEFPPKFKPSTDPRQPAGHLKPFGYQRPPNGPVIEYDKPLRPEKFWEDHVSKNLPLVFRGGISESPALTKWTDSYIKEKYGDLDVLIEKKKENRTHGMTSRMLLGDFIDQYRKKDIYVVTVMPDPMREEVQVVSSLLCGTFVDYLHETNFWMGSGGTRSVIHYDADHNIHCMVAGRKDFIMINQKYRKELKLTKFPQFGSGFSMVDPDVINLDFYPDMPNVEWTYATINAGDCIFLPSGYIHQVRSYARSISATMLFTASINDTFEPVGCEKATFEYTPMSKVKVHYTYKKGDKLIAMGFMGLEKFRKVIINFMNERKIDKLTAPAFEEMIEEAFPLDEHDKQTLQRNPQKLFKTYLDRGGKGYLTVEDVKKIPQEDLKIVALNSESSHGPAAGDPDDYGLASKKRQDDDKELDGGAGEDMEGEGDGTESEDEDKENENENENENEEEERERDEL